MLLTNSFGYTQLARITITLGYKLGLTWALRESGGPNNRWESLLRPQGRVNGWKPVHPVDFMASTRGELIHPSNSAVCTPAPGNERLGSTIELDSDQGRF